jgi:hemerythrin-like domain-containing protein
MDLSQDHADLVRVLDDCLREAEVTRRNRVVDHDRVMAILTAFFGPAGEAHVEREKVVFREIGKRKPELAKLASTAISTVALGGEQLRRVAHYLDSAVSGDPASRAEVAESLLAAEKILRPAIALEDDALLPLTDSLAGSGLGHEVERELREIDERQRRRTARHETCRRIASVLWA